MFRSRPAVDDSEGARNRDIGATSYASEIDLSLSKRFVLTHTR